MLIGVNEFMPYIHYFIDDTEVTQAETENKLNRQETYDEKDRLINIRYFCGTEPTVFQKSKEYIKVLGFLYHNNFNNVHHIDIKHIDNEVSVSFYGLKDELVELDFYYRHSWKYIYDGNKCLIKEYQYSTTSDSDNTLVEFMRIDYSYHNNKLVNIKFFRDELPTTYIKCDYCFISGDYVKLYGISISRFFYYSDYRNIHSVTVDYDKCGNVVSVSFFGFNELPVACSGEVHCWKYDWDEQNNLISESYFGAKQEAVSWKSGGWGSVEVPNQFGVSAHRLIYEYDDKNRVIQVCCFDICNKPNGYRDDGSGAHKVKYIYDDTNSIIYIYYYSVEDKPIMEVEGHLIIKAYDSKKREISVSFYGLMNEPIMPFGTHKRTIENSGNEKIYRYYDINNDITSNKEVIELDDNGYTNSCISYTKDGSIAKNYSVSEYDIYGNCISMRNYNCDKRPLVDSLGYHMTKTDYDIHGNMLSCSYYGVDEQPVNTDWGHKVVQEYDKYMRNTWKYYYDTVMRLVNAKGIYVSRSEYERSGKETTTYYDTGMKPCDNQYGVHKTVVLRVGDELVIRNYDVNGVEVKAKMDSEQERATKIINTGKAEDASEMAGITQNAIEVSNMAVNEEWVNIWDDFNNSIDTYFFKTREFWSSANKLTIKDSFIALLKEYSQMLERLNDTRNVITDVMHNPENHFWGESE